MTHTRRPLTRRRVVAALVAAALAAPVAAHGPTPQRLERAAVFDAPPERLWALLADFSAITLWHPDVEDAVVTGGSQRGGLRRLTLAGGTLGEGIDDIDAAARTLRWRLKEENPAALPASFYMHTMAVKPEGDGATLSWTANLYRADTGNYPVEGSDDKAAVAAMEAFMDRGLAGLRAALSAGGD